MAADIKTLLESHPLFVELDPGVTERISGLSRPVTLDGDQTLFFKGNKGDALYGVRTGRIRISASDPEGKEVFINVMGPGDIFGEIALLDGRPRTADAMAMVPTELYQIRRADFVRLIEDEPQLLPHLIKQFCLRRRMTTEMPEDSAFLSLSASFAKRLLAMSEHSETTAAGERSIKISQVEWSSSWARHGRASISTTRPGAKRIWSAAAPAGSPSSNPPHCRI